MYFSLNPTVLLVICFLVIFILGNLPLLLFANYGNFFPSLLLGRVEAFLNSDQNRAASRLLSAYTEGDVEEIKRAAQSSIVSNLDHVVNVPRHLNIVYYHIGFRSPFFRSGK